MAIIVFDKDSIIKYVPAYGDNRESENPCIVNLKYISYSRVQFYAKLLASRNKGTNDVSKIYEYGQEMQKKQFVENVESISGFFIGDKEITDPAEFYESAPTQLIYEIIKAMEDSQKLSEGQRKNS